MLGRAEGHKNRANGRGLGQDFIHVANDDATRLAFVAVFGDEKGDTCAEFMGDPLPSTADRTPERWRRNMACACEKKGKTRCAWCKEAIFHKLKNHNCSEGGPCD